MMAVTSAEQPKWRLPHGDEKDLIWRFCEAEAACGVRSSQSAQQERLIRKSLPDARSQPKGIRLALADRKPRVPMLLGALVAQGYEAPEMDCHESEALTQISVMMGDNDEEPEVDRYSRESSLHRPRGGNAQTTFDEGWYEQAFLIGVDRARRVDRTLRAIGPTFETVLHMAYGPRRGEAKHNEGLLKSMGRDREHLLEIVVCIAAQESAHESVSKAREELSGTKQSGRVWQLCERASEWYWEPAAKAYAGERGATR